MSSSKFILEPQVEAHHRKCVENCKLLEGKMLKCMNLKNIDEVPCPNLIHVECSEYCQDMLDHLECYYCADCMNQDETIAEMQNEAEERARKKIQDLLQASPTVPGRKYKKLEEVATQLGSELDVSVRKLEENAKKLEESESSKAASDQLIAELQEKLKLAQQEISQLRTRNELLDTSTLSQAFTRTPFGRASTAFDNDQKLNDLSRTLHRAEEVHSRISARKEVRFAHETSQWDTSCCTTGWPDYLEQEKKVKAMDYQALLLVRSCTAIQPFAGEITLWSTFVSDFIRTSANGLYREHEDMERLRDLIRGEAREMFMAELTDPNAKPMETVQRLNEFYGIRGSAVKVALERITQSHRIEKPTDKERIKNLYSLLKQYVLQCHIHKQEQDLEGLSFLHIVESKLCSEHKNEWRDWAKSHEKIESAATIIVYLEEQIRDINIRTLRKPSVPAKPSVPVLATSVTGGQSNEESDSAVAACATRNEDAENKKKYQRRKGAKKKREVSCFHCRESHPLYKCAKFCALQHNVKLTVVAKLHVCKRCLCTNQHEQDNCTYRLLRCRVENCNVKNTHPLLHGHTKEQIPSFIYTNLVNETTEVNAHFSNIFGFIVDDDGNKFPITMMIDSGCSVTLATQRVFELAKAKCEKRFELTMKFATDQVHMETQAKQFSFKFLPIGATKPILIENVVAVCALDIPKQAQDGEALRRKFSHLKNIPLPSFELQMPQVLLGLSHVGLCAAVTTVTGKNIDDPAATLTKLGWCVSGNIAQRENESTAVQSPVNIIECVSHEVTNEELMRCIKAYQEIDSVGIGKGSSLLSKEQQFAKELCASTMRIKEDSGRYEVGLTWANPDCRMPDNYDEAVKRLFSTEKRLLKLGMLDYVSEQFDQQINDGWLIETTREEANRYQRRNYVYGFLTFNNNKRPPRPRWVNDTASTYRGVSLNSMLLNGPDNLTPLLQAMCAQREGLIGYQADVKSMFNQSEMKFEDQFSQLVLWRDAKTSEEPKIYRQTRIIFGPKCSPFVTGEIRIHHAKNCEADFPEASQVAINQTYVDDVSDSRDTVEEAVKVSLDLIHIFDLIKWPLVQFQSNSRELLNALPPVNVSQKMLEVGCDNEEFITKVLGIFWMPAEDVYIYQLNDDELRKKILDNNYKPIKKEMLSILMRMFDPANQIAPFRIRGHIILQKVWRAGTDWKASPPDEIIEEFRDWLRDFELVTKLKLPRCYAPVSLAKCELFLHIFVDAGEHGYGACAYIQAIHESGIFVRLIAAKARVAPIKYISIPRLELMSAVLGARLLGAVKQWHYRLNFRDYRCWTDSDCTLKRITSYHLPRTPFTAPRIDEIQDLTSAEKWLYVPTADNVADYVTKVHNLDYSDHKHPWHVGPKFLYGPKEGWPKQPEKRKCDEKEETVLLIKQVGVVRPWLEGVMLQVSSKVRADWRVYVECTAKALRFVDKARKIEREFQKFVSPWEVERAENFIFRLVQKEIFKDEYKALSKQQSVSTTSAIHNLAPYMCVTTNLIRASTRLSESFPLNQRCPVILPNFHEVTDALVRYYHLLNFHVADNAIIAAVRSRAWVVSAKSAVRRCRARCAYCIEKRAKVAAPITGELPDFRLDISQKSFFHVGVDLFGPYETYIGRSKHKTNVHVCIFTCMVVRAVYFEVVPSQSAEDFVIALEKLWARRGPVKYLYSDNARNFLGATNLLESDEWQKVQREKKLIFKKIPALSPNFGGAWERLIKDVKRGLDSSIGKFTVHRYTLEAVLAKIETNLNNRPLTDVPINPADDTPLTPYLLMTGFANYPLSDEGGSSLIDTKDVQKLKVALRINHLVQCFKKRFIAEYAPIITRRKSNRDTKHGLKLGDVVIYLDITKNSSEWPLAVVSKIYPGRDNKVRVADIRLKSGAMVPRRSVYRLAKVDYALENDECQQINYVAKSKQKQVTINLTSEKTLIPACSDNLKTSEKKRAMFHQEENYILTEKEKEAHMDTTGVRTVKLTNIQGAVSASNLRDFLIGSFRPKTFITKTYNSVDEFSAFVVCESEQEASKLEMLNKRVCVIKRGQATVIGVERCVKPLNVTKLIKHTCFRMVDPKTDIATLIVSPAFPTGNVISFFWPHECHGGAKFIRCEEGQIFDFVTEKVSNAEEFKPKVKKLRKVTFRMPERLSSAQAAVAENQRSATICSTASRLVEGNGEAMRVTTVSVNSAEQSCEERATKKRIISLPLQAPEAAKLKMKSIIVKVRDAERQVFLKRAKEAYSRARRHD